MRDIVEMKFGSHLYGTSTPSSDTDFKAVHLPSGRDILLQRVKEVYNVHRTKGAGEKNTAEDTDRESYALHRYLQLLAEGQTVALDMLFCPPDMLLKSSMLWEEHILKNKARLLTRKSASFVGYCRTQANKYGIKGSRVAAARAACEFFQELTERHGTQSKIGDHGKDVMVFAMEHEHTAVIELPAVGREGAVLLHLECCNKKIPFTNTVRQAAELFGRVFAEYGERARAAETGVGIDWKALSHAVRVGYEALELLRTGHITFPLPYRSRVLMIKQGQIEYPKVAAEIEQLLVDVEAAEKTSDLPYEVDKEWIDSLVVDAYRGEIR